MDFDTIDKNMRRFEQSLDRVIKQDIFLVARLDGHGFTKLTKCEWNLEKPFDPRFHDAMMHTMRKLMIDSGFHMVYGYTQSDEISLLFHIDDRTFAHKERKLLSLLASEASVAFSMYVGHAAVFDCRLVPLPGLENVVDYFRWRQEDAHRNSLDSHCYWMLRKQGLSAFEAQKRISGISMSDKNKLLFSNGINYNVLPSWQRLGIGAYFTEVKKEGYNPKTQMATQAVRRELSFINDLPSGSEYDELLHQVCCCLLPPAL